MLGRIECGRYYPILSANLLLFRVTDGSRIFEYEVYNNLSAFIHEFKEYTLFAIPREGTIVGKVVDKNVMSLTVTGVCNSSGNYKLLVMKHDGSKIMRTFMFLNDYFKCCALRGAENHFRNWIKLTEGNGIKKQYPFHDLTFKYL